MKEETRRRHCSDQTPTCFLIPFPCFLCFLCFLSLSYSPLFLFARNCPPTPLTLSLSLSLSLSNSLSLSLSLRSPSSALSSVLFFPVLSLPRLWSSIFAQSLLSLSRALTLFVPSSAYLSSTPPSALPPPPFSPLFPLLSFLFLFSFFSLPFLSYSDIPSPPKQKRSS